ncbi:MAG TPA: gliding motility protein GldM, partial [Chitinophagaceae bacterium]|nr:gliding motility protein GldM [Chitinophagaceae bacterium]
MSLPREPRQKMINMMYLVLTALLALNVSSEILNAFKTVNKSLENTNVTVNHSTETIMKSLVDKLNDSVTAEKARRWYPKALAAQSYSKEVFDYLQKLKNRILTESGGDPNDPTKKYKEDNLDIPTRIMVDKGEGKKLFGMLKDYQSNILTKIDPAIGEEFKNSLPISLDKPESRSRSGKTWEGAYFHMVPSVAALTILSKFQMDIKTSENRVVAYCHNKVGEVIVRYDTYAAFAETNSSYVMPGDEMQITAGVGAFSRAAQPTVIIDGQNVALESDGAAHRKVTAANTLGKHVVNVSVTFKDQDGKMQTIPRAIEYTVGQAAASIALDKMNVLYIGVDNPISISTTGGGSEQQQVSITGGNGNMKDLGGGHYIARVNSVTDECFIAVSVNNKLAGKSQFRVRTIPRPVATVGGAESGDNMTVGQFRVQTGVGAYIKDFP